MGKFLVYVIICVVTLFCPILGLFLLFLADN